MASFFTLLPLPIGGGGGGGGISSINGDTSANQFIVGSASIGASTAGGVTTISLVTPIPIASGGTGQSNQQAALNNLTDIGSHSNGDVMQLLGGNAQFAPLVFPPSDVTSVNGQTGAVFLAVNGSSIPSDASNNFAYSNNGLFLDNLPGWTLDPTYFFSNVNLNYHPNNLAQSPVAFNWNVNIDPLQNSPDDSIRISVYQANLDSSATGFSFGTNGAAVDILGGGFNYGGNGASFGVLRNINFFGGLGNGTDPGTFKQIVASAHSYSIAQNITLDGAIQGYDFNVNVNASAVTTSNFNVLWITDFSQFPVDVYGYQGVVCQPTIATIKNNHNFSGFGLSANITTMEGNAGYYAFNAGGTITTLGTSGYSGLNLSPNIGSVPATANVQGLSMYPQITTMAATSGFIGSSIGPVITTLHGSYNAYQSFPQIAGGDGQVQLYSGGLGNVTTTGNTAVLNLNGQTATGANSAFSADGIRTNLGGQLIAADNQSVQGQHVIFTQYQTPASTTITGTDIIVNILSPDIDTGDATSHLTMGPNGLGFNMVGFAGQIHGHGTIDQLSALAAGAIFLDDFTVPDYRGVNALMINAGFTGSVTSATAYYHEIGGAGPFATTHWGFKIVTDACENYVPKMAINTASKTANAVALLDMESTTKGFLPPRMSTAQKTSITAVEGLVVYDLDLHQLSYYNGTTWVNV